MPAAFVKTKVELPDDFDMRPVPVPRVKRIATEPTPAPVPTTTEQAVSNETATVSNEATMTPAAPTVVVSSSATATPAEEMDDLELEDVYKGPDPLAGIREEYNPSSQEEQPMDTNEGQEKVDILATAIVEGEQREGRTLVMNITLHLLLSLR